MNNNNLWVGWALFSIVILLIGGLIMIELTFPDPDPYYYKTHSGIIIAKNESRSVFYIETEHSVTMVIVGSYEFTKYDIGDHFEWVTQHRRLSMTNVTM